MLLVRVQFPWKTCLTITCIHRNLGSNFRRILYSGIFSSREPTLKYLESVMKVMASYIPAKHEEDTEMLYKHPSLSGTVSTWLRSLECRLKCAGAH